MFSLSALGVIEQSLPVSSYGRCSFVAFNWLCKGIFLQSTWECFSFSYFWGRVRQAYGKANKPVRRSYSCWRVTWFSPTKITRGGGTITPLIQTYFYPLPYLFYGNLGNNLQMLTSETTALVTAKSYWQAIYFPLHWFKKRKVTRKKGRKSPPRILPGAYGRYCSSCHLFPKLI